MNCVNIRMHGATIKIKNYELFVSGPYNILLYFIIIYVNVIIIITNDLYVRINNNIFKILHRCTDKKQIFQLNASSCSTKQCQQ